MIQLSFVSTLTEMLGFSKKNQEPSWLNEHEFKQTPGDTDGQGRLVCCIHGLVNRLLDLETEQQQQI